MANSEWLLERITSASKSGNIYEARSWLLTAKSLFPTDFLFHFQAYKLEYEEKNSKECALIISDIFRQFPSEKEIWDEFEAMVTALCYNNNSVKEEIFGLLQPALQQQIMTMCLGKEEDVTEHCNLMIVLMKRFPETIMRFGVSMTEKLVDEEKASGAGTPLNKYRRLLVCDILPVLCSSKSIEVSAKHFYKWLQKATEFYATYFTKGASVPDFKPIENPWEQCDKLLTNIAQHCGWDQNMRSKTRTVKDRISHISELHRKSRTDVLGKVNKKQVFYTAILLLVEASSKYAREMLPSIYTESHETGKQVLGHVIIDDLTLDNQYDPNKMHSTQRDISSENVCEYFHAARESWNILHSNDSFDKDFSHLYRRWKMDRWMWLQIFLVDYFLFRGNYSNVLAKLENIMQNDVSKVPKCVLLRCSILMASAYYSTKQLQMSCQAIMDSMFQLPDASSETKSSVFANLSDSGKPQHYGDFPLNTQSVTSKTKLSLVKMDFASLLPTWVEILLQSLSSVMEIACNDTVMGHSLVLLQHNWYSREKQAMTLIQKISEMDQFKYPLFFDYIINISILEEFAYLKTEGKCKMSLLPTTPTLHQRVTRGLNKEVSEDFKKAMERQIRLSRNNTTNLIRSFLTNQHHSILNNLNFEELDSGKSTAMDIS